MQSCRGQNGNNAYYVTESVNNNNNKNNNNGVLVSYEFLELNVIGMNDEWISLEEVENAYFECRKNKRNSKGALLYEMDYEINNYHLWQDLNEDRYEIGYSIAFCVTRPKLREVFAADFRDRIVHHIIMRKFLYLFDSNMIEDSYNCRKGKGTLYAVNRVKDKIEKMSEHYTKETWVLRCDIQGFFMSIDKDILWRMVDSLIRDNYHGADIEKWISLIRKVVMHRPELRCVRHGDISLWDKLPDNKSLFKSNGIGLPIGNLTSQIFANFYMTAFDKWAVSVLGDGYGRFVDDFVAISADKKVLLQFLYDARIFLADNLKLRLHPNKIYLQEAKKGILFVGTYIKPNRTYTGNRTVNNTFEVVRQWNRDEHPNTVKYVQRINSYMGFLIHNASYRIRRRIWEGIDNKKGIYIVNFKKLKIIKNNELRKSNNAC